MPLRRPRDARLRRRRNQAPDVDVALALLEGRRAEQTSHQPPRVALELAALGGGVAVAEHQQIELCRRVAGLVQLEQRTGAPARRRGR